MMYGGNVDVAPLFLNLGATCGQTPNRLVCGRNTLLETGLRTVVGLLCIELLSCVYFCYLLCIVLL
jgi:hypothetical protein